MSKKIVLSGSLVDVRNIAAHKCVRLAIDVPAERAAEIVAAFGWPSMTVPVPVAVARLDPEKAAAAPPEAQETPIEEKPKLVEKERRMWDNVRPSQQAGIRCDQPGFQKFLEETYPLVWRRQAEEPHDGLTGLAARAVRMICMVESRSALTPESPAALRWHALDTQYQNWMRGYGDAA